MNYLFDMFARVVILIVSISYSVLAYSQPAIEVLDLDSDSDLVANVTPPSEFDNHSEDFVKAISEADPDYEDTEFGELLYNEASLPTRLEILRLLSKDTPAMIVFLHAVSMGLGIDDVLEAAVRYEPAQGRDFAQSAVAVLPLLNESVSYRYSDYDLEDLEREDESKPYSILDVAERFFDEREVLTPYPDWFEGQFHFNASVAELSALQDDNAGTKWYRTRSDLPSSERPIFVSLYEHDGSILIDGKRRIKRALKNNGPDSTLPVVFIFNRLNERAVDMLEYPKTIRGLQQAYAENGIMLTPTPEWQDGEYHIHGTIDDLYEIFELPDEEDFEPEQWESLVREAENYKVANTAFIFVVVSSGEEEKLARAFRQNNDLASWDNPRTEAKFPFASRKGSPITMKSIMGNGLIINRPDLVVALRSLGVTRVPIAFYYIDEGRTKPYNRGQKGLTSLVTGLSGSDVSSAPFITGGFGPLPPAPQPPPQVCASPPCNN